MMTATNIKEEKNILKIFTFWFEEYLPSLYNEFKNQEKQTNGKKLIQFEKLFTISIKLSKAYFGSANICQKKLTIQLNFGYGNFIFMKWEM